MEKSQAIWLGAERTICFKHSRMVREIWLQYCIVIENMTVTEGVMCSNVNCNQNATVKNNNNVLTYLAKSKFLFFLYIEPEQMYMRVKYHSILSETKTMYFFVPGFYYCQQLLSLVVCRMHSMRYFFFCTDSITAAVPVMYNWLASTNVMSFSMDPAIRVYVPLAMWVSQMNCNHLTSVHTRVHENQEATVSC